MDADASVARPIGLDFVMFLESGHDVVEVFFTDVFYAKIFDHKCEANGSCGVLPVPGAGYQFALEVTVFVEPLFKELVCKKSCLR